MKKTSDFFELYPRSVLNKDKALMLSLYADKFINFDMWEHYVQHGKAALACMVNDWFDSLGDEKVVVGFKNIELLEDTALASANAFITFRALNDKEEVLREMKNRISLTFAKQDEEWYVVHQHTSVPISNALGAIIES